MKSQPEADHPLGEKEIMNDTTKQLIGTIVSNKMSDTVTVKIDSVRTSRLYRKKYTVSKKINADCKDRKYEIGDIVSIVSIRPISKTKSFKVTGKVK